MNLILAQSIGAEHRRELLAAAADWRRAHAPAAELEEPAGSRPARESRRPRLVRLVRRLSAAR